MSVFRSDWMIQMLNHFLLSATSKSTTIPTVQVYDQENHRLVIHHQGEDRSQESCWVSDALQPGPSISRIVTTIGFARLSSQRLLKDQLIYLEFWRYAAENQIFDSKAGFAGVQNP